MNRASRWLVLLLALTVALAGVLAYEAQRATRSHRVTAERALRDYATVAARELAAASAEGLESVLAPALDPIVGSPAASPYDPLTPASAIAAGAGGILACADSSLPRTYFGYDLRTGALSTAGAPADAQTAAWLRASVGPAAGTAIAWGAGPMSGRIAVYRVKLLRYSGYAVHDAPLAAYGLVTCRAALGPVIARVLQEHPLLPRSVSAGLSNAELAAIEVRAPDGAPLFRFGPAAGSSEGGAYAGDDATAGAGSPVFSAALPAAVAGRLVVARPGSRLPLLLGLLAVTAGLAAVALRQLRREQELARLRADFTSSVSHELRTPLTQILLFAETLELGRAGGEGDRRRALRIIVQEARRLAHLVENVLQFSRAERRMVRVRTEERRLAPLLRETVDRFTPLAGSGGRIESELDEALVAPVHPDSLRQIVLNLLDNAVKYGGERSVVLRACGSQATAPGWKSMTPDPASRRRSARGSGSRSSVWSASPAIAGSGIGLAVVRELVAAHGGSCWVETAPGGGARVVVELPGARRASAIEAA